VLVLAMFFSVAELIGGWLTGSLALVADAFHLISDVAALAISLFAAWMTVRPSSERRTFGHSRAEILAALANGVGLGVVACLIIYNAIDRFGAPTAVDGLGIVGFATAALLYEAIGLWILSGAADDNLNVRGAFLHVLSDALGSIPIAYHNNLLAWMPDAVQHRLETTGYYRMGGGQKGVLLEEVFTDRYTAERHVVRFAAELDPRWDLTGIADLGDFDPREHPDVYVPRFLLGG